MAAVIETEEPVTSVHIDGLAALKIVKHCQESLPQMVTGSLLGLAVGDGVLEITHAFPFPEPSSRNKGDVIKTAADDESTTPTASAVAEIDGHEYQLEMMKMLREVNVDNNCVGWYQSMYLGSYSTQTLVENQLSYQTDLSPNAVVVLYDPVQTSNGRLVLKCFRLTDECVRMKKDGTNEFIDPRNIFEELPVTLTNPGLVRALLFDVGAGTYNSGPASAAPDDGGDGGAIGGQYRAVGAAGGETTADYCSFDNLDLSTNPYLEKHLEFLCSWVDDLAAEQQKFQYYARNLAKGDKHGRNKGRDGAGRQDEEGKGAGGEGWASSDAPRRMESLLIANQIRNYCDQVDKFAGGGFGKLFLASGLHEEKSSS